MFKVLSLSLLSVLPLTLVACSGSRDADDEFSLFGEEAAAKDSDGDGLTDAEEAELGLDALSPDSDGDGYDDGLELEENTDGLDADDHPYTGGWEIGACRNDLQGTGDSVGDIAEQFELLDQHGDTVRLHDFCDKTVLLVSSAEWCAPCNDEAPIVGAWYDDHAEEGLMVITLLSEDSRGRTPDTDTLMGWQTAHGLSHPVVADAGSDVTQRYVPPSYGIPTMHLIGPGGEILATDTYLSESDVVGALP